MPNIEWGRVHSHLMLAAIWGAIFVLGAGMMAFGSDPVRIVGMWLVGVFGFLTIASLVAAAYVWRSQTRASQHKSAPELGAIDFVVFGGKLAEQLGQAFLPINIARKQIVEIHGQLQPQYTAALQSRHPNRHVRAQGFLRQMASDMNPRVDQMERALPQLDNVAAIVAQGFNSMALHVQKHPNDREGITRFRDSVAGLLDTMKREREQGEVFQRFMENLRGDEADLSATSVRGVQASGKLISAFDRIRESCREAIKTADRLLRDLKRRQK